MFSFEEKLFFFNESFGFVKLAFSNKNKIIGISPNLVATQKNTITGNSSRRNHNMDFMNFW